MKSVPNIISTKDLSYIEDMLNWNFILIKKINTFTNNCEDEEIVKCYKNALKVLNDNYNKILNYLE